MNPLGTGFSDGPRLFLIRPSGSCTRNETGPIWSRTSPVSQVIAPVKFSEV